MNFEFATAARIVFGAGTSLELPSLTAVMGRHPLVVVGRDHGRARPLLDRMAAQGLETMLFQTPREPTVDMVLEGVETARTAQCDIVVGIGGGSVIDMGKAIAALVANPGNIFDYLEVIGRGRPLTAVPLSYIAVPTTSGTGAEVTRNAVLGSTEHRVKVSLRSPLMLPDIAIVDPLLTHSMPPGVTAGTGLDALTQLMEAFVSNSTHPLIDGICREGIRLGAGALEKAVENGKDAVAREHMSMASLFGGMALANAKLGAVHGIAGPLGGMISAPHGALCGRLLPFVAEANIARLRLHQPESPALSRYAEIAHIATGEPAAVAEDAVAWMRNLCERLKVPTLKDLGMAASDMADVCRAAQKASSMKGNPIALGKSGVMQILEKAF